jgi:secondary thiamine-phosphate synthase enzyme
MIIHNKNFELNTEGFSDCHDITPAIKAAVHESRVQSGLVTIMVPGSTAAVTTIEFESGAVNDLKQALERLAPVNMEYAHNLRWGDGNGFSHVRAALMRPSLSVPVMSGRLCLGTWQQLVLLDFDNRPRKRSVVVQVIGE